MRGRYRVVLLDEYQDTGHAQRVALSSLFGGGVDDGLALTAVGDPIQSIYGWRGASATNLPRFTTDFPVGRHPGADAGTADQLAQPTPRASPRQRGLGGGASAVGRRARTAAPARRRARRRFGARCYRTSTANEIGWQTEWRACTTPHARGVGGANGCGAGAAQRRCGADGRRADRAGVPVEVVGLAGLLSIPEVADVVAMLRLAADPRPGLPRCVS